MPGRQLSRSVGSTERAVRADSVRPLAFVLNCTRRRNHMLGRQVPEGAGASRHLETPDGQYLAMAIGQDHSCAIGTHGAIACWGENSSGNTEPPEGSFADVAVGRSHSCRILSEGGISCWGSSSLRRLQSPDGRFHRLRRVVQDPFTARRHKASCLLTSSIDVY